ncbi:major capsid protein [Microviridae sp.]|nr:major capsid protein [Microviridae sp.]
MKSVTKGQHTFAQVPQANIQRSSFNRSSGWKGTMDSGYLVPIMVDEILPGDTFNHRSTLFGRMATPIYPLMDNMFLETFFFFVPNRLVFENWQRMMGEQDNPGDSTDFILPTSVAPTGGYTEESLQDYMGIPTKVEGLEHNTLHMRAYNLIYNEWFRDQNLQDSVTVDKGDGPDDPANYTLLRRGKRHDYFTSALPWPQKGAAVEIPLGGTAPIVPSDGGTEYYQSQGAGNIKANFLSPAAGLTTQWTKDTSQLGVSQPMDYIGVADLSSATAATINQLREAFQIQKMYERDARGGTRYISIIKSHFGISSPDARLQRPEFLGGGSVPISINPVQQTSDIASVGGQGTVGTLGAQGTVTAHNHGFTKSFTEHGVLIGLANIRADLTYQQGLNRMWSRSDRFDFYFPALASLGEQEILNKEIYAQGVTDPVADEEIFGYQERFAEYRYSPSTIHGQFRSNATTPLDAWHLSQDFADLPTLSSAFIEDNPPVDRVIAVPSEPQFILDIFHKTIAARPMPLYGVPGNIDRF